jgi:hypothetical protein
MVDIATGAAVAKLTQSAPSSLHPQPRTKACTSACRWCSKARASEESCRCHPVTVASTIAARCRHFRHHHRAAAAILPPPLPSCRCHRAAAKLPHPSAIATAVALPLQPSCCCRRHHRAELAPHRFRRHSRRQATASGITLPPHRQATIATAAKLPSLPMPPPPSPHAAATRYCRQRRRAAAAILPPPLRCQRRQAAATKSVVC